MGFVHGINLIYTAIFLWNSKNCAKNLDFTNHNEVCNDVNFLSKENAQRS